MTPTLSEANETLKRGLALARTEPREALAVLDEGLRRAQETGNQAGIVSLAKHAGVLCTGLGDLQGAVDHYRLALAWAADDGYLHLALGDALLRLGENREGRDALARGLAMARAEGDADLEAMVRAAQAELD